MVGRRMTRWDEKRNKSIKEGKIIAMERRRVKKCASKEKASMG